MSERFFNELGDLERTTLSAVRDLIAAVTDRGAQDLDACGRPNDLRCFLLTFAYWQSALGLTVPEHLGDHLHELAMRVPHLASALPLRFR